jgi:guanylate kinase
MNVRRAYPKNSVLVFILPPSPEVLRGRLSLRKADSKTTISKRLKLAKKEISYKDRYDYSIVNDKLENAYRKLKRIITKGMGHARDTAR